MTQLNKNLEIHTTNPHTEDLVSAPFSQLEQIWVEGVCVFCGLTTDIVQTTYQNSLLGGNQSLGFCIPDHA